LDGEEATGCRAARRKEKSSAKNMGPTTKQVLNLGFGNFVLTARIVAVVNPASSPMRRLREDARKDGRLIDATQGRKTRSLVITDSNHVILSAVQAETMRQRFQEEEE
jgi:regulator of extracellular matrix RemA (YlzA/DUF370 family)